MNILEQNQREDIRYKNGDIILYEPTDTQIEELKNIIISENIMEETDEVSTNLIRQVFRMLVDKGDFIDDYTDEELNEKLNNGNKAIKDLLKNIGDILNEVSQDIINENMRSLSDIKSMVDILDLSSDFEEIKQQLNNMLKESGADLTLDDIINMKINQEQIVKE